MDLTQIFLLAHGQILALWVELREYACLFPRDAARVEAQPLATALEAMTSSAAPNHFVQPQREAGHVFKRLCVTTGLQCQGTAMDPQICSAVLTAHPLPRLLLRRRQSAITTELPRSIMPRNGGIRLITIVLRPILPVPLGPTGEGSRVVIPLTGGTVPTLYLSACWQETTPLSSKHLAAAIRVEKKKSGHPTSALAWQLTMGGLCYKFCTA